MSFVENIYPNYQNWNCHYYVGTLIHNTQEWSLEKIFRTLQKEKIFYDFLEYYRESFLTF